MKDWLIYLVLVAIFTACGLGLATAQQNRRPGTVVVPPTSVEHPANIGRRAHTNFLIFVPAAKGGQKVSPNASAPSGETPGSLSCIYQTWAGQVTGCPIGATYAAPTGGSNVIAVVDAYDYPSAAADFLAFSNQFNLPTGNNCGANGNAACFTTVYATGSQPALNCGWAQEAALDIEWAHAMAPHAQIILVEAASSSYSDLMDAVQVASGLVSNGGGGQVSMSWGGSEFRTESTYDSYFNTPGVTYFASSGDSGSKVIFPSSSANVIAAGGTSINRNSSGNFTGESAWRDSGGGASRFVPVPGYQSAIYSLASLLNGARGTPDLSFDADPYTGVSVYDTTSCQGMSGWMVFGGTSVAAPSLAGIVNQAGAFDGGWDDGTNSASVQSYVYNNYSNTSSAGTACSYSSPFYDVTAGSTGKYSATGCWDFTTGIGTLRGKDGLAAGSSSTTGGITLGDSSGGAITLAAGSSVSDTITVSPTDGFTGTVSLSLTGNLPKFANAGLSPTTVTLSSTGAQTSVLTIRTNRKVAPGNYTLTVTGTSGSASGFVTINVTVP